jgi:hypothetical protein
MTQDVNRGDKRLLIYEAVHRMGIKFNVYFLEKIFVKLLVDDGLLIGCNLTQEHGVTSSYNHMLAFIKNVADDIHLSMDTKHPVRIQFVFHLFESHLQNLLGCCLMLHPTQHPRTKDLIPCELAFFRATSRNDVLSNSSHSMLINREAIIFPDSINIIDQLTDSQAVIQFIFNRRINQYNINPKEQHGVQKHIHNVWSVIADQSFSDQELLKVVHGDQGCTDGEVGGDCLV